MTTPAPIAVASRLLRLFGRLRIPHALGGALAYGYWAPPRGTHDVDMNVFAGEEAVDAVVDGLLAEDFEVDRAQAREAVAEGSHIKAWYDGTPVEIFFNSIPLHESAASRLVKVPFAGSVAPVLSAEDLVLLKLLFFRSKDLQDIANVLATQGARLDRRYVRDWLVDMLGDDDDRTTAWDRLCAEFPID